MSNITQDWLSPYIGLRPMFYLLRDTYALVDPGNRSLLWLITFHLQMHRETAYLHRYMPSWLPTDTPTPTWRFYRIKVVSSWLLVDTPLPWLQETYLHQYMLSWLTMDALMVRLNASSLLLVNTQLPWLQQTAYLHLGYCYLIISWYTKLPWLHQVNSLMIASGYTHATVTWDSICTSDMCPVGC